jgi:hypothetical protein
MATLVLPARHDVPFFDFEVDLEGRTYTFTFRWNERAGAWFFTLRNATGTILVAGRKVVLGARLMGRSRDAALPPGALFAIDTAGTDVDPGRDDLGSRVLVVYSESTVA